MRHHLLLALLVAALVVGCSITPDVGPYAPKAAADCPGQKACGYRCLDVDDPAAGCGLATCAPCPAGPANTVPMCGAAQACAVACLPGFAATDGNPAHGCGQSVSADRQNCGALGHVCPAGVSCSDGMCQEPPVTEVAATGVAPRGLAVLATTFYWAVDPPLTAGGATPQGAVLTAEQGAAAGTVMVTNLGHPTQVTARPGPLLGVLATDPFDDTTGAAVLVAAPPVLPVDGYNGRDADGVYFGCVIPGTAAVGVAISPYSMVCLASTPLDDPAGTFLLDFTFHPPYPSSGGGIVHFSHPLRGLGEGGQVHVPAGFDTGQDPALPAYDTPILWAGGLNGVWKLEDHGDGWDYDLAVVPGGDLYFDHLGRKPFAERIAALPAPDVNGVFTVWFADPTDGSVWVGRTTGAADSATPATPWRLVRGDGVPRAAMDLAADAAGVVWSDLDAGEIWAATPAGQVHRLASGVKPWAIALSGGRVYFTDVAAQAIRSVAR